VTYCPSVVGLDNFSSIKEEGGRIRMLEFQKHSRERGTSGNIVVRTKGKKNGH